MEYIRGEGGKFSAIPVTSALVRTCSRCNTEKDLQLFGRDKTGYLGKKRVCKKCESVASNAYNKKNPEKIKHLRRAHGLRKYGLTPQCYEEKFEAQGNRCGLCGAAESGGRSATFPVDHCHKTGAVRDILCNNCNLLLGHANDDVELLKKAIAYLNGYTMVTSRNAIMKAK